MTTGLHSLKKGTNKRPAARVGRGGTRGKTSGRGHKGQKARSGSTPRPQMRDIIKKFPKQRGYGKNRSRTVNSGKKSVTVVSLARIDTAFAAGDVVSPKTLTEKGIITARGGTYAPVKILANGELKTKVNVEGCAVSDAARGAVEKAGGSVK